MKSKRTKVKLHYFLAFIFSTFFYLIVDLLYSWNTPAWFISLPNASGFRLLLVLEVYFLCCTIFFLCSTIFSLTVEGFRFGKSFFCVISCRTTSPSGDIGDSPATSINTGKTDDGEYITSLVFSKIRSVVVSDRKDPSHRIELLSEKWTYNQGTTEITLLKEIPFEHPFIHVEGYTKLPQTFIFGEAAPPCQTETTPR